VVSPARRATPYDVYGQFFGSWAKYSIGTASPSVSMRCHHGTVAVTVPVSVPLELETSVPVVVALLIPLVDVYRSTNIEIAEIFAVPVKLGSFVAFNQSNSEVSRS
jgi:hypothetical protein